jgi:hypothetical protein
MGCPEYSNVILHISCVPPRSLGTKLTAHGSVVIRPGAATTPIRAAAHGEPSVPAFSRRCAAHARSAGRW